MPPRNITHPLCAIEKYLIPSMPLVLIFHLLCCHSVTNGVSWVVCCRLHLAAVSSSWTSLFAPAPDEGSREGVARASCAPAAATARRRTRPRRGWPPRARRDGAVRLAGTQATGRRRAKPRPPRAGEGGREQGAGRGEGGPARLRRLQPRSACRCHGRRRPWASPSSSRRCTRART